MARSFTLDGVAVKTRHPLAPLGLGLITLGLYNLYWYYAINREMRDLSYTWKLWMRGREKKAAYPPESPNPRTPVAAGGEGTPDVESSA